MTSSNLIVNSVTNSNTKVQPTVTKTESDAVKKPQYEFSNTEKVIGGLSALVLLGTGIYFAIRHGKVSGNKFKTIAKKDGSMERLFPNGNTVNIRTVENDNGWSRTITVTDSNGKKICERRKSLGKHSDYLSFDVETKKAYNSEGDETIKILENVYKTKDKTEIRTHEYYYNEKGESLDDVDTNLLKHKSESKTLDKNGKLIKESSEIKERNNFGSFDEHKKCVDLRKGKGLIRTSTTHVEHLTNDIKKTTDAFKDVDSKGNTLWDRQETIFKDKNKKTEGRMIHSYSYKLDDKGKPVLANGSYFSKRLSPLNDKNKRIDGDISYYCKVYNTGEDSLNRNKGQTLYEITDYRRIDGEGSLKQFWADLDGNVIEGSLKQIEGENVEWNTII